MAIFAILALCFAGTVGADVKVPALFGDHMVVQRDMPVPVWGWADPGEKVTVVFGTQMETA
ncbi:MAG: sialate O-acetylesterase, partial [Planctomycetes bacterium]|nr:sialate O-acetylesterase [Planctomycetota bacterium]